MQLLCTAVPVIVFCGFKMCLRSSLWKKACSVRVCLKNAWWKFKAIYLFTYIHAFMHAYIIHTCVHTLNRKATPQRSFHLTLRVGAPLANSLITTSLPARLFFIAAEQKHSNHSSFHHLFMTFNEAQPGTEVDEALTADVWNPTIKTYHHHPHHHCHCCLWWLLSIL